MEVKATEQEMLERRLREYAAIIANYKNIVTELELYLLDERNTHREYARYTRSKMVQYRDSDDKEMEQVESETYFYENGCVNGYTNAMGKIEALREKYLVD